MALRWWHGKHCPWPNPPPPPHLLPQALVAALIADARIDARVPEQPQRWLAVVLVALFDIIGGDDDANADANASHRFLSLGGLKAACDCVTKHDPQGADTTLQARADKVQCVW